MRKKRSNPIKIKPPKENPAIVGIATGRSKEFHQKFPFQLTHKDREETKTCWFCEEEHMKIYIERYKLNPKSCIIRKTEPETP